ncbi:MAG: trypsin-like peptidase domain-containing protein [Oligoflexia bacterium]|nr:trypsin-like peptidase domain-containing protein [Oligoflexia bacterium]
MIKVSPWVALLCIVVGVIALGAGSALADEGELLYKKLHTFVFQIKTSKSADAPKLSYGSGFVVNKEGYLLTNYHVISSKVHDEDDNYKVYVVIDDKNYEAKILGFNIIHDIAVVKIDKKFDRALTLKREAPAIGQEVYSLGLPQDLRMAIVSGTYNGVISDGPYERVFMTTPINSGMSGGPTVNSRGEVIGVNVSHLIGSLNITFSVPIGHAMLLLQEVLARKEEFALKNSYALIGEQLKQIQNSLLKELLTSKSTPPIVAGWMLASVPETLKCWGKNTTSKKKQYQAIDHFCHLKNAAYLENGNYSGSFELQYTVLENLTLSSLQFYRKISSVLASDDGLENIFLSLFDKTIQSKYACDEMVIVNPHKISFKIATCFAALTKYQDLYKLHFKAITLNRGNSYLLFKGEFNGISKENSKRFLEHHLARISFDDDGGKR